MSHDSPSLALIDKCVHCGFCLPTCPTYLLWGEEMDSPRGRIYLMKATVEKRAPINASYVRHLDACLGCVSCVTACPSGVRYGALIEQTRAQIEREYTRGPLDRLFRAVLLWLVPYPARMRLALLPMLLFGGVIKRALAISTSCDARQFDQPPANGGIARGSSDATLLQRLVAAMRLAPPMSWADICAKTAPYTPAQAQERMKVAMLTGCIQRVSFGAVNEATVRVLSAEGCSVSAPPSQGCCGALALHAGYADQARAFAKRIIKTFEASNVDRVVVNAAGCGSAMKEYGELLAEDPAWAARAKAFSAKVRDVAEVLVELGEPRAPRHPISARIAYHDACHLAHGQNVRVQPRALLQAIPGVQLVTPTEAEICCGSAGIYNLVQPEPAAQLGARKVRNLAALSPDIVVTGNPGCILQLAAAARDCGLHWPLLHFIEVLDASMRGLDPRSL